MTTNKRGKTGFILLAAAGSLALLATILYQSGTFSVNLIPPGQRPYVEMLLAGRGAKNAPPPSKPFTVVEREQPVVYTAVGTVRSRDEVELSSRALARVVNVNRRSGDTVKRGELLLQLDDADLQAAAHGALEQFNAATNAVEAARQAALTAESARRLAELALRRDQGLFAQKVVSRKSLEETTSAFEQADSNLNAARQRAQGAEAEAVAASQAYKQAQANLSHAAILSPLDGIVSERLVDPGDLASPGKLLMTVFDPKRLMLYAPVRESLVDSIHVGDKLDFSVAALGRSFQSEVREIVPSVDPGSRTFLVKTCVAGESGGLMPGMFGSMDVKLGVEKALVVPAAAVARTGQLEQVELLDGDKPMTIFVRTVATPLGPGLLQVVQGLKPGDKIAVPGN